MEGYWTVREYADECHLRKCEVETLIKRKLLVTVKIDQLRYIPKNMPKYKAIHLAKIPGVCRKYMFAVDFDLSYLKKENEP